MLIGITVLKYVVYAYIIGFAVNNNFKFLSFNVLLLKTLNNYTNQYVLAIFNIQLYKFI